METYVAKHGNKYINEHISELNKVNEVKCPECGLERIIEERDYFVSDDNTTANLMFKCKECYCYFYIQEELK